MLNDQIGFNSLLEKKEVEKSDDQSFNSVISTKHMEKKYTDDALIYQTILKYCTTIGLNQYFKVMEISRWVSRNCQVYTDLHVGDKAKTTYVVRAYNIKDRIKDALENLEHLDLIISRPTISHNKEETKEYTFTKIARLIGLLLFYQDHRITFSQNHYQQIVGFYQEMEQSQAKLFSIFLEKSHNKYAVFEELMEYLFSLLENATTDKELFVYQISNPNPMLSTNYWQSLYDSFAAMDNAYPLKYEVLFYNLKLNLELINERKSRNLKGFEEFRFQATQDCFFFVLEGYCKSCNRYTPCIISTMHYIRSYANNGTNGKTNLMDVKCPNSECLAGRLDFEFINKIKIVKETRDSGVKKKRDIRIRVIGSQLDAFGTIFEQKKANEFTNRSKRYQAILKLLHENQDRFFKKREMIIDCLIKEPEAFDFDSTKRPQKYINKYNNQFDGYLNDLKIMDLVVSRPIKANTLNLMIEEYQLSRLGNSIALISKAHSEQCNDRTYDEIYNEWIQYFEDHPFSLDRFCKKYCHSCKESKLFNEFVKHYIDYFLNSADDCSITEFFTRLILLRFKDNESINEKLWDLWKDSLMSLDGHNGELFLNHIRIHLNRLIEKKVHDYAKYEDTRYHNRDKFNKVVIEGICKNCPNEYTYFSIPIILYVTYLFYGKSHEGLYSYSKNTKCQKCNRHNFEYIWI